MRLRGYDYTQAGAYYVTICTKDRQPLFGQVFGGKMQCSRAGHLVADTWIGLPAHYHIELDAFVVMPNHIHAIIVLFAAGQTVSLWEVIRGFKTFSARSINQMRDTPGVPVWHRGYYEHIIRDEVSLNHIRRYIAANPRRWSMDRENPEARELEPVQSWDVLTP